MNSTARFVTLLLFVVSLVSSGLQPALAGPPDDSAPPAAGTLVTADPDTAGKIRVIGRIALEHPPGAIGVNPVTNRIYIANSANWLTVIDGATNAQITSFFTGSRFSQQLGIDTQRNRIFMANSSGNGLIVIDGDSNKDMYSTVIGSFPEGIAVDTVGRTVYIAHSGSVLSMVDAETLQPKGMLYTARWNHTLALNPRLHRLYVPLTDPFNTDVIDTSKNLRIGTISASGNADANYVTGKIYMADFRYNYVTVVDGKTNKPMKYVTKDSVGGFVSVNPTTNCIYVTNPDSNTVSVIDGRTDKLLATVTVGARPQQIAVNPANGLVYVSNTGAQSVHIIQDNLCGRSQRIWRLLYYLPGDNMLDGSHQKLVTQFKSLEGDGTFHTAVLYDGARHGDSRYYAIDETLDELDKGELNTGAERTLMEWIGWSRETLPARYTALIVAGHGNLGGAALDEGAGSDTLKLREMRDALKAIADRYGRIDVLYMNSSLMGTIEGAYELQPYVDYYVSSQNTTLVDVDRLSSSYLNNMAAALTPRDLALNMGRSNAEGLKRLGVPFTVSVADLERLPDLVYEVNDLARLVRERMPEMVPILKNEVMPVIQRFDMNGTDGTDQTDELVDLYDFVDLVGARTRYSDVRNAAERVKSRLRDDYIIFEAHASGELWGKRHSLERSNGVSIFFPSRRSSFYGGGDFEFAAGVDWSQGGNNVGPATDAMGWAPMLVAYVAATNAAAPDVTEPPPLVAPAQDKRVYLSTMSR